ncbi:MAG: hypothetical protein JWP12_2936 [Bacteroidetes bacterium]|nr:hypothetical protein [Bacteroidota bacterium]
MQRTQFNYSLLLLFIFCVSANSFAQKNKKNWDPAILAKANTAKDDATLTVEEKKVILYMNLVRLDPAAFVEIELKHYMDSTKLNDGYTKSLIKTLAATKPMDAVAPSKALNDFAKEHAIKFGKENKIGHGNYKDRIKNIIGNYNNAMAENCDYGNDNAFNIVMSLLIDEDIKDLAHRKNILNPIYKFVGVSIKPHKGYEWNCVTDFGG